eukprot:TCALIF_11830-PA protein Name:"Similar to SEPSECS O-phosphoseryl-tRNA(Sec) selenium transferase (Homo sapiens)" AED:0.08 eAED:0.08 QI:0/0/0/0.83/1/1/6/0/440
MMRKLPEIGWSDTDIETLLLELARMDSNNFPGNCGVGERESRIHSQLVYRRHFGLGHGIGRSGDLCEVQPKAAGSSTLNKLTNALVLDVIRQMGVRSCQDCFVVPMATGMALTLCLLALRKLRPHAKYVLWSRIDQKSCFKSILCAGFTPVIIELVSKGDQLDTNLTEIDQTILKLGPESIACILTTTSCFAPRAADDLVGVAKLAQSHDVPQLVNNAYGIQSSKCMHLIEEMGKIQSNHTTFVQSTDKNFLVPVGGAIVAGFDKSWIKQISQTYPGRASSTPSTDLFITLMSLGIQGYKKLVQERKSLFQELRTKLHQVAEKHGERLLETKGNPISMAVTLSRVVDPDGQGKQVSAIGSMLFTRGVSGTRVITGKDEKSIEGLQFSAWGSHWNGTQTPYLTAAAAIGMTSKDIDLFVKRLDKVLTHVMAPKTHVANKAC